MKLFLNTSSLNAAYTNCSVIEVASAAVKSSAYETCSEDCVGMGPSVNRLGVQGSRFVDSMCLVDFLSPQTTPARTSADCYGFWETPCGTAGLYQLEHRRHRALIMYQDIFSGHKSSVWLSASQVGYTSRYYLVGHTLT